MHLNYEIQNKNKSVIKEPKKYKVVVHNDDFTPVEFVIDILMMIFHKNQEEATNITMAIHKGSKAVVGTYSYDIAHTKKDHATMLAREEGYPFLVTVEE